LADFPFYHGEGVFESHLAVQNIELAFNPRWPHLYDMKGKIFFNGASMFVDTEGGGRIGNLPLLPVHGETSDFVGDGWLIVSGEMDSDLATAMKFLQQTPVRYIPERLAKAADLSGDAHLKAKISIPLAQGDVAVDGLLQLKNDTLSPKGLKTKVMGLTGDLSFTESVMAGKQLTGRAFEQPIGLDVDMKNDDILLNMAGKAAVPELRKAFPGELWAYTEGSLAYTLGLKIPKSLDATSDPLRISLASDLSGLELSLPEPLTKPALAHTDFIADLSYRQAGRSTLRLAYGQEGRVRLTLASASEGLRVESGDLEWGKSIPAGTETGGMRVFVKSDELDLDAWRKVFGETTASTSASPRALDIQLNRFHWKGEDLGLLRLTGKREGETMVGEIDCKYAKGSYSAEFPEFSHATLHLNLDSLILPKLADADDEQTKIADPADWPAMQIHARHFIRQGADLGELELETERWTLGQNIKKLTLQTENHDLALRGSWMRQAGQDETRLEGSLKVRDLGDFIALLGFGREIQATPAESSFYLAWNGAPQQYSAARVAGDVTLKTGRGRVLQVEPGLGRALGMLNLQSLRRLLQMDFSDMFGKGLAYDGMEGSFHLVDGQAKTKAFVIDAVAADILMMGRVGLADHDLDQTISILPHPLASIPLAVPMVGGAAVGAVIDIAHRLVGAESLNLASSNYSVTGAWDNPQLKRIQGSSPLEIVNRAWSGIRNMSGIGLQGNSLND
jgi:uncharacterized protein (TIGR02099 family)